MADHPMEPEELTAAGLPSARRGFDRKAVVARIEEAAGRWRDLRDRHDEVIAEIDRRGGIENLGRDLREIGERVATILGEAQGAAEDLRRHAVDEAQARLDAAEEQAAAIVAEADRAAFGLRKDAWETGAELLRQVRATMKAMVERAEADTLIIRANAEQDAHRHLTDARKEAADLTRGARFEAERVVGEAKRRADELLADAAEAEAARPTASGWGVRVLGTEGRRLGGDPAVEIDPHHPAYGDVLAAEVSSLRRREQAVPPPPPPDEPPPLPPPVSEAAPAPAVEADAEPDPDAEPAPGPEPELEPEPLVAAESEPEPGPEPAVALPQPAAVDEVGGLFERLRRTDEIPVVPVASKPRPKPREEPRPAPEPEAEVPSGPRPPDPVDVRDRLMLPILNEHVRSARRELAEIQNIALDEVRTLRKGAAWHPDTERITGPLRAALATLASAAVEAGGRGAAVFGAGPPPEPVSDERAQGLIDAMAEALVAAVAEAAASADPAAAAGRLFRTWRNDEVERWVRTAGYAGYHDGLVGGLAASGVAEIVGIRHGRMCRECPAAAGVVWDPAGPPPAGFASPPAHLDCTCAVEPHG